jgi:hypothetical protein
LSRRRITSSATNTAIFFMFRLRLFTFPETIWPAFASKYRGDRRSTVVRAAPCDGFVSVTRGFVPLYTRIGRTIRAASLSAAAFMLAACGDDPTAPASLPPGDPDFRIEVRFWGDPPDEAQVASIRRAADRWERMLRTGLPDVLVRGDAGCGPGSPAMDETVDDLVIFVRIVNIPSLAEAGPCKLREGSNLPLTATVWLDGPTRLDQLSPEFLESLATHEIGHALGFGSLWAIHGLLREPALLGGADPHFVGPAAGSEFDAIGGVGYVGAKVPLETGGGDGTADSHWRLRVFGEHELMTAVVGPGVLALSRVTAASMADLGYDVDLTEADGFSIPGLPAGAGAGGRRAAS